MVPELVRFKEVAAGVESWASDLLQMTTQPRNISTANERVSESPFSITNSARALLELYEGILA